MSYGYALLLPDIGNRWSFHYTICTCANVSQGYAYWVSWVRNNGQGMSQLYWGKHYFKQSYSTQMDSIYSPICTQVDSTVEPNISILKAYLST